MGSRPSCTAACCVRGEKDDSQVPEVETSIGIEENFPLPSLVSPLSNQSAKDSKESNGGDDQNSTVTPTPPESDLQETTIDTAAMKMSITAVSPDFLTSVPIFNRCLSAEDIEELAAAMTYRRFEQGETFIHEGDEACEFFVITEGSASVLKKVESSSELLKVATVHAGDVFGESSLISGGCRNASIRADTELICFSVSADQVKEHGLHTKLQFHKRHAIGREGAPNFGAIITSTAFSSSGTASVSVKEEDIALVNKAFQGNKNLKHLVPSGGYNFAKEVVQSCSRIEADLGQVVVRQGDPEADCFFIIESGTVSIDSYETGSLRLSRAFTAQNSPKGSAKTVCTLKAGQSFGELALLYKATRAATVTALEKCSLLSLDRNAFKEILKKAALAKSSEHIKYFKNLEMLSHMSAAEKRLAATAFESVHFMQGDVVYEIGDPGTTLYVLIDGKIQIKDENNNRKTLEATYSKGVHKYFGQSALLSTTRRDSTVTVTSAKARALMLDRDDFSMLLGESMSVATSGADDWIKRIGVVSQLPVLSSVPDAVKETLARAFKKSIYEQGDKIYAKGDTPEHFYVLLSGCIEIVDAKCGGPMEGPMHFGDKEIFDNKQRKSTVKVISDSAHVLRLSLDVFTKLLLPYRDKFSVFWATADPIYKNDLSIEGLIAKTPFGVVELCTHTKTGNRYVLKTMKKDSIVEKSLQQSVMKERSTWIQLRCPFIVQLVALYNEPNSLHFLSEFITHGSLAELFHQNCFYSSEKHARFYIAGIVVALRYMHNRHLIHRDVKPENVLISNTGYPKLFDFAFAKSVVQNTFTVCGTPEYMSPEVLAGGHQTRAVDWWAVGIMVFEFMTGTTPFRADDPWAVYANIMKGIKGVDFPAGCKGQSADLVTQFCKHEVETRLSAAPKIMTHNWFAGFDWQAIASLRLEPPYKPPPEDTAGEQRSPQFEDTVVNPDSPKTAAKKRSSQRLAEPVAKQDSPKSVDKGDKKQKSDKISGWDRGFASNIGLLGTGTAAMEDMPV